jgi:nonsense-mediated mRNA decay protein 3
MQLDMESTDIIQRVLCCECGVSIEPNPSNMCIQCIQSQIDITSGVMQTGTIQFCKVCERYLNPPKYWVSAALESKELLELCLKRIKGLNKVHLVDAIFLWTEPHSRRLKIKLTIQAELYNDTSVQQTCVVEFIVHNQMCDSCQKEATGQPQWTAVVQARQRTGHKKTMLHMEQLILKHNMHKDATRIEEQPDGIDFFYAHKGHAQRMVDFLASKSPLTVKISQELVSHDIKSNVADIHWCFIVEIAPICKNDIVFLPLKYHQGMGGLGPVCICAKVQSNIVLLDPVNLRGNQIPAALYWKGPFESYGVERNLVEFIIQDIRINPKIPQNGKYISAEAEVQKADEIGTDRTFFTMTHLGGRLQPGDSVMGYLLEELNSNEHHMREYKNRFPIPEVVLVKKKEVNKKDMEAMHQ